MDSIALILDNLISTFENKYGFEVEADFDIEADSFKPLFNLAMDIFPKESGKREGDSRGVGENKIYWDSKRKAWLPMDVFNATRSLSPEKSKIKPLGADQRQAFQTSLDSFKGKLNLQDLASKLSKIQEEGNADEVSDELKKELDSFLSKNKTVLDNYNKTLQKIDSDFGSDIAKTVKRVILRSPSLEKAKESLVSNMPEKEKVVFDYEPKMKEDKDKFTKDDRKYIQNLIKKNPDQGIKGILKDLKGKFNEDLMIEIQDATEKFKGLRGLYDYLDKYDSKRDGLKEWQNLKRNRKPEFTPTKKIPQIEDHIQPIMDYLKRVKEEHKIKNYDESFLGVTERALKAVLKYARSSKRDNDAENALIHFFGDKGKVSKAWRKARIPQITTLITQLPKVLANVFGTVEWSLPNNEKGLERLRKVYPDKTDKELKQWFKHEVNPSLEVFYKELKDSKEPYAKEIMKLIKSPVEMDLDDDEKEQLTERDKGIVEETKEKEKERVKKKEKDIKDYGVTDDKDTGITQEERKEEIKEYKKYKSIQRKKDRIKAISGYNSLDDIKKEIERLTNLHDKDRSKKRKKKIMSDILYLKSLLDETEAIMPKFRTLNTWLKKKPVHEVKYDKDKGQLKDKKYEEVEMKDKIEQAKEDMERVEKQLEREPSNRTKKYKELTKRKEDLQDIIDSKGKDLTPEEKKQQDSKSVEDFYNNLFKYIEDKFHKTEYKEPPAPAELDVDEDASVKDILKKIDEKEKDDKERRKQSPWKKIPLKDLSDSDAAEVINGMNKLRKMLYSEPNRPSVDIPVKEYLEWRKNKKKANVFAFYKQAHSVEYRLEKLANFSSNGFVKAELLDILDKFKELI